VDDGQEDSDAQEKEDGARSQPEDDVGPLSQDPAPAPEPANDNYHASAALPPADDNPPPNEIPATGTD